MRWVLLLTLFLCLIAAVAAVSLDMVWLGYVGTGSSLATNPTLDRYSCIR
jgi:hypothetical protein